MKTTSDITEKFPNEVLEDMGEMPNYNNWVFGHFMENVTGKTVEIGAGLGTISERLRPHTTHLELVEPTPLLADRLKVKFGNDCGCRVSQSSLEHWLESVQNETYNTAVMVNVLEHIEDDFAATRGLFNALKPGGRLLIFVPALPFLFSDIDRFYGHFRRYRRDELRLCVENAGFVIEKLHYLDILGILPWWLLNTLLGKKSFHKPSLTFYDKFVVPPAKLFESVIPLPIGKSLVLVARKISTTHHSEN